MQWVLRWLVAGVLSTVAVTSSVAEQPVTFNDGRVGFVYYRHEVPSRFWRDHCDRHIFADVNFSPLPDGRYTARGGEALLVEAGCLFLLIDKAKLHDGRTVYFFQENDFNLEGHLVYFYPPAGCRRVPNGSYRLSHGQRFQVTDGRIADAGIFEGKEIIFEDRD